MIAAFFGGELVWRERDRGLNELIDSTAAPSWVMTVPKILAIFVVLLLVNVAATLTGLLYQLTEGVRSIGLGQYATFFIIPVAIDALQIAVLAVFVQVLSPNKYVGWGILFVGSSGGSSSTTSATATPSTFGHAHVPLSDFVGSGTFWKGAAVFRLYWTCFAIILAVLSHLLWPRGTDLGLRSRGRRLPRVASMPALAIGGVALALMLTTGAYAYYNIKTLNRYETSDQAEKYSADYERKYPKFENLPQPAIKRVALNVQLYPRQQMLVGNGTYSLVNEGKMPIDEVHVRQAPATSNG